MAEQAAAEAEARAGETAALLSKTVLTIQHRAGEDGKLFGSVTNAEIADAISEARGLRIDRKKIKRRASRRSSPKRTKYLPKSRFPGVGQGPVLVFS